MIDVKGSGDTTMTDGVGKLRIRSSLIFVIGLVAAAGSGLLLGAVSSAGLAVVAGLKIELMVALPIGVGALGGALLLQRRLGADHARDGRLLVRVLLVCITAGLAPGTMLGVTLQAFGSMS